MAEKTEGDKYTEKAGRETDTEKLRELVNRCAADLDWYVNHIEAYKKSTDKNDRADERRAEAAAKAEAAATDTRTKALRALSKLIGTATAQAKKGKPALLRLILRATK